MSLIGANIKYLRERHNLTQKAFGELFNCSRDNIASYERENGAEPKWELVKSIGKYFHINVNDLYEKDISNEKQLNEPNIPYRSTDRAKELYQIQKELVTAQDRIIILQREIIQLQEEIVALKANKSVQRSPSRAGKGELK